MRFVTLTDVGDRVVTVNLENVAYMASYPDSTTIFFSAGESPNFLTLRVRETAEQILDLADD